MKHSLVREKQQRLAGFGVLETDAPQMMRIILLGIETIQADALVADHATGLIRGRGIDPMVVQIRVGADNEESARPTQDMKTSKNYVSVYRATRDELLTVFERPACCVIVLNPGARYTHLLVAKHSCETLTKVEATARS